MICKGKEKYLFTMYGRAGPVPLPLPPPALCRVSGVEGEVAARILPGDSEWERGALWQVNTAGCNRTYFLRVKSAGLSRT
jgi:hypothetical protein